VVVSQFDVFLVSLDPTLGREIKKMRPCLVVSPDEMNRHLGTALVAPMTTKTRAYPTRVACRFRSKTGEIALDQLRAVDRSRLVRRVGRIQRAAQGDILAVLAEMFAR